MEVIIEAVDHTPWWVYVLFALLLARAIKAMRSGTVAVAKLAILPVVLTCVGLINLVTTFETTLLTAGAWLVSLAIGGAIGWTFANSRRLRADPSAGLIWREGSKVPLLMMLGIFVTKYTFGFLMEAEPALIQNPSFYLTDIVVSGLISGFFIGQLANVWSRMRSPSTPPISQAA